MLNSKVVRWSWERKAGPGLHVLHFPFLRQVVEVTGTRENEIPMAAE